MNCKFIGSRDAWATIIGIVVGVGAVMAYRYAVEYTDARQPAVELIAAYSARTGDAVSITMSGRQLRADCQFVGIQGFSISSGGKRFPATLTWLTPSPDVSRKTVGVLFDLGIWRIQPVPDGFGVIVEETNVCGTAIVSNASQVVRP